MLQGRLDNEPRRRGIARVKELIAGGVNVACGQDCIQDAFYPFGAADQLQIALLLAHAAQLSAPDEIPHAFRAVTYAGAQALRLEGYGVTPGGRADLVVLDAETIEEALRLQADRRWVLRDGLVVAETERREALNRAV
jgi:cytosine deaminase